MSKDNSMRSSLNSKTNEIPTTKIRFQDRPMLSSLYRRMVSGLTSKADSAALSSIFNKFSESDIKDLAQKDSMGRRFDTYAADFLVPDRRHTNKALFEAKVHIGDISMNDMKPKNVFEERLNHVLFDGQLTTTNVLRYTRKPNQSKNPYQYMDMRETLGNIGNIVPPKKIRETIETEPVHVFNSPGLLDDYYLNVLDCSGNNKIALGLLNYVYVWNNGTKKMNRLSTSSDLDKGVCSLRWSHNSHTLAIGFANGNVEIWDMETSRVLRTMEMQMGRIASLAWNNETLTSGTRSGFMYNHDVRIREHKVHTYKRHSMEVCGLKWSYDSRRLASGGNDDIACVWDINNLKKPTQVFPHQAAVKALDWNPQNSSMLATGGGSGDRQIRIFNVLRGFEQFHYDTGSQVSSVYFSKTSNELFSSHGTPGNDIAVWSLPKLEKTYSIPAHSARILSMVLSPDGAHVATISSDCSFKVWTCVQFNKQRISAFTNPFVNH